jgi:WD40 repeat protein
VADVFVSYSRRDAEFVQRLARELELRGKDVWVDVGGIRDAEVFPEALRLAIQGSDGFVFVISPDSIGSRFCEQEVEHAVELNKRIVPLVLHEVPDERVPEGIRVRNWIPAAADGGFAETVKRLVAALETDLAWTKEHTGWLVKALEWDAKGRDRSLLLRGSELAAAERWLAGAAGKTPEPTRLHIEHVLASRTAAARRQRVLMGASLAVAVVSIGLLIFALISRGQAISSRAQAVSERIGARAEALAAESQAQLSNDPEISLILGMRAVKTQATPQTLFALRAALDASPLERGLPPIPNPGGCGQDGVPSAALRPDGREIAEGGCTGLVRILDAATGRVLSSENIDDPVISMAYNPSGSALALATAAGVYVLAPRTGPVLVSGTSAAGEQSWVAFSPNGRTLATDSPSGLTIGSLGNLRPRAGVGLSPERTTAEVGAPLGGTIAFSPDGRRLFVGGWDSSVHVYDAASGRQIQRILAPQHGSSWQEVVAVSPNGRQLAIGYPTQSDANGTVSIYSTHTWRRQFTLMTLPDVQISALAFSPDGTRLAIGAEDGVAGVWSVPTRQELVSYKGPTAAIDSIQFTPDGDSVLTASADGIVRLWRAIGVEQSFQTLPLAGGPQQIAFDTDRIEAVPSGQPVVFSSPIDGGRATRKAAFPHVQTVVLSADGRFALGLEGTGASSVDATQVGPLTIWDTRTGRLVRTLPAQILPSGSPEPVTFSWNDASIALDSGTGGPMAGAAILSVASGRTVRLQGAVVACGAGSSPNSFAFSRDDRRVAGAGFCGYADVWDARTGRLLRQVDEGGEVSDVDLSPDGSRLLVSSWDSRATIWSVATGHRLVNLIGDTQGLFGAAFSPNGSLVATSSLDQTVRIWNAYTGQELRVLSFPDGQWPLVFNSDGSKFAVADTNPAPGAPDIVRVFDACPACTNAHAMLSLAASQVTSQLTVLERTVVDTG